jgi:serine/threonine protein kinase
LIKGVSLALEHFCARGIVHADLKPCNILWSATEVKIIDFGSAYSFGENGLVKATTPEYLAPEILTHLVHKSPAISYQPWSTDMWSLGIIVLEIIDIVPIWMSLKCRVENRIVKGGLLGVSGRDNAKILQKQADLH